MFALKFCVSLLALLTEPVVSNARRVAVGSGLALLTPRAVGSKRVTLGASMLNAMEDGGETNQTLVLTDADNSEGKPALPSNTTQPEPDPATKASKYSWPYRKSMVMQKRRQSIGQIALYILIGLCIGQAVMVVTGRMSLGKQASALQGELKQALTLPRWVALVVACILTMVGTRFIVAGEFHYPKVYRHIADEVECKLVCEETLYAQCETMKFHVTSRQAKKYNYRALDLGDSRHDSRQDSLHIKHLICQFEVFPSPWVPYTVMALFILSLTLIVEGIPADLVFVSASILLGFIGILDAQTVWDGLAGGAVVSIAMLMVVGSAITETGVLDVVIASILGKGENMLIGLSRMLVASTLMSMFLPNAPMFLLISPIMVSWGRRLNFSKKKLLAPIGIALQVGGQCTVLGSAAPMVAKTLYPKSVYDLQMFELAPIGLATAAIMLIISVLCLPLLPEDPTDEEKVVAKEELPDLAFLHACSEAGPSPDSRFDDDEPADAKSSKVSIDSFQNPSKEYYFAAVLVKEFGPFEGSQPEATCIQLSRLPGVLEAIPQGSMLSELSAGSQMVCRCTAEGIVNLRKERGLDLDNIKDLMDLGKHRRKRHLYEGVVSASSPLIGEVTAAKNTMSEKRSAMVAISGKLIQDEHTRVDEGDTILLEASDASLLSDWQSSFSMLKAVPGSSPPRQGVKGIDHIRSVFVLTCFAAVVTGISLNMVSVSIGAGCVVILFLVCKAVSVDQAYDAIKGRALLIIVGSMGMASALQAAGIAHFLCNTIASLTLPYGPSTTRAAIYIVTAGLSQLVSKTCSIAIVGPMMPELADAVGVSVQSMVWLAIFAAGGCFITPFGEPASIFVMKDGEYTYGQFARYGIVLQMFHGVATVGLIRLLD